MWQSIIATVVLVSFGLLSTAGAFSISALEDDRVNVVTKEVLEGDNLILFCNQTQLKGVTNFVWLINSTYSDFSEYGIAFSEFFAKGWKLEFFNISRNASDIYICRGWSSSKKEQITLTATKVDVQYPAEIESASLSPRVLLPHDKFSVSCSMHGNPAPTWSIFNNDTGSALVSMTEQSNDVSMQMSAGCSSSGYWVCSGYNSLNNGVNVTRGFNLTVICPPQSLFNAPPDYVHRYQANVGGNVTMSFDVTGDPAPSFAWSRDDGRPMGARVTEVDTAKRTSLSIMNVVAEDAGNYTLRIRNSYGRLVAYFNLWVNDDASLIG